MKVKQAKLNVASFQGTLITSQKLINEMVRVASLMGLSELSFWVKDDKVAKFCIKLSQNGFRARSSHHYNGNCILSVYW